MEINLAQFSFRRQRFEGKKDATAFSFFFYFGCEELTSLVQTKKNQTQEPFVTPFPLC